MTTPLTKLIEENKWRPIAEFVPVEGWRGIVRYPTHTNESVPHWEVEAKYSDGCFWTRGGGPLQGVHKPTHFLPLPDDRLARVTEVLLEQMSSIAANGCCDKCQEAKLVAESAIRQATAIAEGKE